MGFCPDSHLAVMATTTSRGRVATRPRPPEPGQCRNKGRTSPDTWVAGHGPPGSTVCGWAGLDEEKTISVVTVCFSEVALCGRRHEGDRRTGEGPETGALLVPPSTPGVPGSGASTGVGGAWVAVSRVPQAPRQRPGKKKRDGPGTFGVTKQRGQQLKPLRPLTGLPPLVSLSRRAAVSQGGGGFCQGSSPHAACLSISALE